VQEVSTRLLAIPQSIVASRLGFAARVEVTVLGDRGTTIGIGDDLQMKRVGLLEIHWRH